VNAILPVEILFKILSLLNLQFSTLIQ